MISSIMNTLISIRLAAAFAAVIMVASFSLLAAGKLPAIYFWAIAAACALIAYKIVPVMNHGRAKP
jgi:hypothetical protein